MELSAAAAGLGERRPNFKGAVIVFGPVGLDATADAVAVNRCLIGDGTIRLNFRLAGQFKFIFITNDLMA